VAAGKNALAHAISFAAAAEQACSNYRTKNEDWAIRGSQAGWMIFAAMANKETRIVFG
jgi:hypothetical protein